MGALHFCIGNKNDSVAITLFYSIISPRLASTPLMIQNAALDLINTALHFRAGSLPSVYESRPISIINER